MCRQQRLFFCVPDNTIDREKAASEERRKKEMVVSRCIGLRVQTMREMIQSSLSTHPRNTPKLHIGSMVYISKMRLTHFWNVYTTERKGNCGKYLVDFHSCFVFDLCVWLSFSWQLDFTILRNSLCHRRPSAWHEIRDLECKVFPFF